MKNVYDIRKEEQLQFVLSAKHTSFIPNPQQLQSIAIVVHLYYEEKVKLYSQYLNSIPETIMLYIFSSKEETLREAKKYLYHKNTIYLKKENRGRDLSAFLVAFRPYLDLYDLICFIHDKKEQTPWVKQDVDKWNENLWENMVASTPYIYNILDLFENRPELGVLFPPEPIGKYRSAWFRASWMEDFDNCIKLAQKMELSADLNVKKPPIALGSVFWARKAVLGKLFQMNWEYEDFPEEPMPADATISHAVERILGFIAQDAGYEAGTVMTEQYASWLLLYIQDYFRQMFSELSNRMGIDNLGEFYALSVQKERIVKYIKGHDTFFLYGAGKCGRALLKILREEQLEPEGFLVTKRKEEQSFIDDLKVCEITDLNFKKNGVGIILTVFYPLQKEMIEELEKRGIYDFMILFHE